MLTKLHRQRQKLGTFAHALRWLRTVAVTQSVDTHRRATRRKAREQRAAQSEENAPPNRPAEVQEAIRAGLAKLPDDERDALALVYFDGLTRRDAAKVLGIDRGTFAARLDTAIRRLQKVVPAPAVVLGAAGNAGLSAALSARPPLPSAARLGELTRAAGRAAMTWSRPWKAAVACLGSWNTAAVVLGCGLVTILVSFPL